MLKLKKLSKVFRYIKVRKVRPLIPISIDHIITTPPHCHFDEASHFIGCQLIDRNTVFGNPSFGQGGFNTIYNEMLENRKVHKANNQVRHNGKTLEFPNLWNDLYLSKTKYNRGTNKWVITDKTPECVRPYLEDFGYGRSDEVEENFRSEGLNSSQLATVTLNTGFAKYLCLKLPDLAVKLGVGERNE